MNALNDFQPDGDKPHDHCGVFGIFGHGQAAQMTYYETTRGAKVFAAGAFTLAGSASQADVSRLLENLWIHLAGP